MFVVDKSLDILHLVRTQLLLTVSMVITFPSVSGGSTIVVLFEKGVVEWDEDLLVNGRAALETLVRVGMGIGNGHRLNAE